jgi:hypothetical protein
MLFGRGVEFAVRLAANQLPDLTAYEVPKTVALKSRFLAVSNNLIQLAALIYLAYNIFEEQEYLRYEDATEGFHAKLKSPPTDSALLAHADYAAAPYCGREACLKQRCVKGAANCECERKSGGREKCTVRRCGRSECQYLPPSTLTYPAYITDAISIATYIQRRPEHFACHRAAPEAALPEPAGDGAPARGAEDGCEFGTWGTSPEALMTTFYPAHVEDTLLKLSKEVSFPAFLHETRGESCGPGLPCDQYYKTSTTELRGELLDPDGVVLQEFPAGSSVELRVSNWLAAAGFGLEDASDSPTVTRGTLDSFRDEGAVVKVELELTNVDDTSFLSWALEPPPPMWYSYRAHRLERTEFKIDEVRGTGPAADPGRVRLGLGETRHVWRRHGLLFEFSMAARVARFSLSELVLAVAEGLAVLEIGGGIMAWITFNLMPHAEEYGEAVSQDFDEERLELHDSMLAAPAKRTASKRKARPRSPSAAGSRRKSKGG